MSAPAAHIDALSARDAEAVAALHTACFARGWDAGECGSLIRQPTVVADGAFLAPRRLIGFALSRHAGGEADLLTIAVASARRRHGIGEALLARHLARLSAAGVTRSVLEVDEENKAALRLYARFGYVEVGTRPAYYRTVDGRARTAKVMALALT